MSAYKPRAGSNVAAVLAHITTLRGAPCRRKAAAQALGISIRAVEKALAQLAAKGVISPGSAGIGRKSSWALAGAPRPVEKYAPEAGGKADAVLRHVRRKRSPFMRGEVAAATGLSVVEVGDAFRLLRANGVIRLEGDRSLGRAARHELVRDR